MRRDFFHCLHYSVKMRVLLAEDDTKLSTHLVDSLSRQGIFVSAVSARAELEDALSGTTSFDAIILDRLLGLFDTKSIIPFLRERRRLTPVLILSAINTPNERTDLIELGADDYLGKPFSTRELIARVRALQRRTRSTPEFWKSGNTIIDTVRRTIAVETHSETRPTQEFILQKTLSWELGRIWSRTDLLECVWDNSATAATNVVETTMTNLRRRLEHIGSNLHIRNMRNTGYWIEE